MHDIKAIRQNPEAFDAGLKRRGLPAQSATILAIDDTRRAAIHAAETALAERNAASKQVGAAKAKGDEAAFERLRALVGAKKAEIAALEDESKAETARLNDILMSLPNLPADDIPDGADENDNVELRRVGSPRNFAFTPKEHYEVAAAAKGLDFETAAKLSGSRFVVLKGAMNRLHRALGQFMLDTHVDKNGFTEMWTPVLVRDEAMYGSGQLPKFAEDSFFGASMNGRGTSARVTLSNYAEDADLDVICDRSESLADVVSNIFERAPTAEQFWLIPTAEVTLVNSEAGNIIPEAALPLRLTAHSQCFRSEAGSAGRDTAGMLRQHQFEKVEMVAFTTPEDSPAELERMTKCAEGILEALDIPFRTVVLCTGDLGFGMRKTYDIEAWLPGQNTYREISSCSVADAFQARRMNTRYRVEGSKPDFVHTLNGSGLAVGRTLIAVVENNQQEDGSITIPEVLRPYMGGKSVISADGTLA